MLILISFSFLVPITFALTKTCTNIEPGVKKFTSGLDITSLSLQPLDFKVPDGYREPLFEFTCKQRKKWKNPYNRALYSIPDQIAAIVSIPGGVPEFSSRVYKTSADVRTKMSEDAGVDNKVGMFSRSSSYKEMSRKITNEFAQITDVSSVPLSAEAVLVPPFALVLSPEADKLVNGLPELFDESPQLYFDFISVFGTHFFAKGKFGGLIRQVFETNSNYYNQHSDKDIEKQAEKSYLKMVECRSGFNTSSKIDENFSKNTKSESYFYGGELKVMEEEGLQKWMATLQKSPWIFGATLIPISELIENKWKRKSMEKAVQAYLNRAFAKELITSLDNVYKNLGKLLVIKEFRDRLFDEALKTIPDRQSLIDIRDRIQTVPPLWWRSVEFCYKFKKPRKFRFFNKFSTSEGTNCAKSGYYTDPYYDSTRTIHDLGSLPRVSKTGIYARKFTNKHKISWALFSSDIGDHWFKDVKLCFKYRPTGVKTQCNRGKLVPEICATLNSYSESYVDGTNDAPGGCQMSWQLRVPSKSPIWLLTSKLCFKWAYQNKRNTGECGKYSNKTICAFANQWTAEYLDDTDSRGPRDSSCRMQWKIQ